MNNIIILGAGLSGLLASYKIRQAKIAKNVIIYEKNNNIKSLNFTAAFYCHEFLNEELTPNNKRFNVKWTINSDNYLNLLKDKRDYAMKIYGNSHHEVSIKRAFRKGWWLDIQKLVDLANINFNSKCNTIDVINKIIYFDKEKIKYDILVSTIPLSFFMNYANIKTDFDFRSIPIYIKTEKQLSFDRHMLIQYFPDLNVSYYRKTYFRESVTTESTLAGTDSVATFPGKILPIKIGNFFENMAEKNIYFAGRYARWEPKHLIHETFNNIIKEIK